jgi:hypothetical protein
MRSIIISLIALSMSAQASAQKKAEGPSSQPPPAPSEAAPPAALQDQKVQSQPGRSDVHFESRRSEDRFTVSIDDGDASCQTPCDLPLAPGKHRAKIEGDASFSALIDVPASSATFKIQKRRDERRVLGIVGLAVGGALVVGGVGLLVASAQTSDSTGSVASSLESYGGLVATCAGLALAAVGGSVGLGTMGEDSLKLETAKTSQRQSAPIRLTGIAGAPTRGGAVFGATLTF